MAAFCINTHSQEFKDTAKRLGVSQFELEQIAYKYGNQEGTFGQFPSDEYIKEQLDGAPDYNATEAQAELWKMRYSTPREFDTLEELDAAKKDALQYFGDDSVRSFVNANGKYELRVAPQRIGSAEEVLLQKSSQNRQRNLETLKAFYAGVISNVVRERRALAEQKRAEYNNILFRREGIDATGRFQQMEAQSALEAFQKKYGSIADSYLFTLPSGDIKLVVKPLSEETLQNRALAALNRMSDSDLASEVQRLSQEYEVDEDVLYYINPKKVEEIKAQIAKKNRVFNEETINESIQFLEDLENTQENNLFVQTAIRWLKSGVVIFPRDGEKVKQAFESARKYGIDIQSVKSPMELQLKILEKNIKEIEAGKPIDVSKYKELSYDRTVVTDDGKQIVIYNVEDSESGQRAVCNILATASPKVNGEPAHSPWCLSTFNYSNDTKTASPTSSAVHFWGHYNKGKRQIAFVDNRPVAFNSSSQNVAESWWDFEDKQAYDDITKIDFDSPARLYENNLKDDDYHSFSSGIYKIYAKNGKVTTIEARPNNNGSVVISYMHNIGGGVSLSIDGVGYFDTFALDGRMFYPICMSIGKSAVLAFPRDKGYAAAADIWTGSNRDKGIFIEDAVNEACKGHTAFIVETEAKLREFFSNRFDINNIQDIANIKALVNEIIDTYSKEIEKVRAIAKEAVKKAEQEYEKSRAPKKENTNARKSEIAQEIQSLAEEEILTDSWAPVQNEYTPQEGFQGNEYAGYGNEEDAAYAAAHGEEELNRLERISGIRYKMRELLQALNFGREKSYANAYNERVLKPLNRELSNILYPLLREWNFEVVEENLRDIFGEDVLGALDVLEKIVYLSDGGDRNQITDAEEFSHAFVKLMGATYRKASNRSNHPENRLYSELRDIIETTDIFNQTLEQYGGLKEYQYENGTPNRAKIAEEALGKALAVALNERYEAKSEAERSFLNKVIQWFKDALLWFKSFVNKNGRLEKELNNIADSILRSDGSYYGKYLQEAPENQQLVTWESTVEKDAQEGGHGMELINFISSIGGVLTGSMSYRAQGTVYRTEQDSLHDLDFAFDASHTLYGRNPELRNPIGVRNLDNAEIVRMVQEDETVQQIMQHDNMHFLQAFPVTKFNGKNEIIVTFMRTENPELAERFRAMSGSYAKRLSNFTEEEKQQIHLIDCFFEQDSIPSTYDDGINIANYKESFKAKLKMGRAKDLIDYRQWRPNQRNIRRGGELMFQKAPVSQSYQQSSFAQDAEFYSGAAQGSDRAWGTEARNLGIRVKDYETSDYVKLSQEKKDKIEQEYTEARNFLGKPVLSKDTKGGMLTRRDMMQADSADAIFAIGKITPANGIEISNGREYTNRSGHENVAGGTANAVARGILRGIPVYVYDRVAKQWKTWDANTRSFIATEEPTLTPHAAVIGTRGEYYADRQEYDITDEEKGIIRSVLQKTVRQSQQQEVDVPETTLHEEPMWAPPKVERDFHERQETIVTKMDNLLKSGNMTVTEVMGEANKAMDWISDQITQYLENPELVWSKYKSGENKEDVIAKVSKMGRRELVDYISIQNLIDIYKSEVLSPTKDNIELFKTLRRQDRANYRLVTENIDGLIQYGYTRFLAREGFGFQISDIEGETFSTTEETAPEDRIGIDDYNSNGVDYNEEVRNQQEHWQIENATRDIMDNASVKVKQAISDCYILENNGKVKEDGTPDYDIATDKLNRNERVNPIHAVRSIVKWTQGAITLSQMVDKLRAQENSNPWISQIVSRLEDTTGNESDFQSQFFNTFSKHFQSYSIVKMNSKGGYYTMLVNDHPALKDAMDNIVIQRKTGGWPLVNEQGMVSLSNLKEFKGFIDTLESFGDLEEGNRDGIIDMIGGILYTIGLPQPSESIDKVLTNALKNEVWLNASSIFEKLSEVSKKNIKDYNPFEYGSEYGIRNFVSKIIKPFTNLLEETMVSSVFDSGKMYQSFITPSWTTKLFQKMHLPDREFKEFVLQEFGDSEWFVNPDVNMLEDLSEESLQGMSDDERNAAILQAKIDYISSPDHSNIWRTPWLGVLMKMSPEQRQEAFQHKVQLNFNKQNYMRGMDDLTYVLSVFTEYFGEPAVRERGGYMFANYRFPMLSNKPSNEFVRFVRYGNIGTADFLGDGAQAILRGYVNIFRQELSRIQTVEMRNLKEGDEGYIANFDANEGKGSGLRFNFLDFLNEYLNGSKKNTALGQLIDRKLHAEDASKALSSEENATLESLVKKEVADYLNTLADRLIANYRANGLFEALKGIEGVGKSDYDVEGAIREFAWNDHFAQANLLQILVTDKAFYKNEEDLQKRLAQAHSPGIRGNWEALDFGEKDEKGQVIRAPQRVSDGKLRVVKLSDFIAKGDFVGNVIANLEAVFDKKVAEASEDEKQALKDLRDNIIDAYRKINVVDGQAFVSPSAYRKKAIAFGEWTKDDEQVYKDLMNGKFNMAQVQKVFNPRKPFTYGKTSKRSNPELNTPIKTLRYGVQYKDSEYLLIMADAILKGQNTGKPNLLGAIFEVMENSYKVDPTQGIDFFVFESGVKTGLMGAVSINEFIDSPDGQRLAKNRLESFIYQDGKVGGAYNENYVDVLDAEDYTTQQTVPEHFMHGSLQWGSQIRALMPSDLETTYGGQPVVYEYQNPVTGETIQKSAEEIREDWEQNTANMVNESVSELKKELGLDGKTSVADSNILISKILQREILSNPRYGVGLLLACSVDADGNFRIPLGDPIQSKRVEQLLNSIIKNRVNKQKVAGGTLVEVTNFGTSKRLNIRFKDKNDSTGKTVLSTREEYLAKGHTEQEFKDYIKNNQGGLAYYECYAPAWARELFLKFADEKGNIDIEAIEMLDSDLLKMYGYRIPTEDKYSTAPYKIVGFLPQEAGDGFMQPWETPGIDGSDFDVDKKNLMRMALEIVSALMSKKEFFEKNGLTEETEENNRKYNEYRRKEISANKLIDKLRESRPDLNIVTSADPAIVREAMAKAEKTVERKRALDNLNRAKEKAGELRDKKTARLLDKEGMHGSELEAITKEYNTIVENAESAYYTRIRDIEQQENSIAEKEIVAAMLRKRYLWQDSSNIPANERPLFLALKEAYIKTAFKVERPTSGKDYYNNLMFNMQWAIATHASTADKMLNPGNFDPQKRIGYMVEAIRLGYSRNELQGKSIDELKKLVFTSKNLMDFDVQTQFYKQNSVAGQVLEIFAVAKSAHAMFESRNYGVLVERPFYIDGMRFFGTMHYDQKYDRTGTTLIGKTLGSLVGASADAVKDPVLNFMNINKETINVLNTALRLGLDFDTIALLLSSKAVSNVLDTYRKNSLTRKTSFDREVKAVLRELEKKDYIGKDSSLQVQNLTMDEMVWAIRGLESTEASKEEMQKADEVTYKILNAVLGLSEISKKVQPLTDLSRLNSKTSAPGPLYIDTIASERKLGPAIDMDGIIKFYTDSEGTEQYKGATRGMVFEELKSLEAFYESYNIAKELFKHLNFTTASNQFTDVLNSVPAELQFSLYSNSALLKSLADFFQSYLLVQSGVIKASELKRYTTDFVKEFLEGKLTQDEKVKNNPLIQAIQPKLISKEGEADRYALSIDTTGMEQSEKDALSAGWAQLEKDDPELSHKLFAYNFFRGGIGFNPKSFMALVPIQVKESIAGYVETFTHIPTIDNPGNVVDQWIRNNWTNTELVTRIKDKPCDEKTKSIEFSGYRELSSIYNSPYIRVSNQNGEFLFKESSKDDKRAVYEQIDPLGGNRECVEMYPEPNHASMDSAQRGKVSLETQDTETTETREDNPEVPQTAEEQTRDLTDFYQTAYSEEGPAESTESSIEKQFDKANSDLDIQTNKDKFDDIMEGFCNNTKR